MVAIDHAARRRFSAIRLAAAAVVFLLAACTPRFDWREMPLADGALTVAFPAKPTTERRTLDLGGHALEFSMTTAQVDDALFAVGYARLPAAVAADPALERGVIAAMENSLQAGLKATEVVRRPIELVSRSVSRAGPVMADELELHGKPGATPIWMLARVGVAYGWAMQVVAVGPEDGLPREAAHTFVESLRIP